METFRPGQTVLVRVRVADAQEAVGVVTEMPFPPDNFPGNDQFVQVCIPTELYPCVIVNKGRVRAIGALTISETEGVIGVRKDDVSDGCLWTHINPSHRDYVDA